MILNNPATNLGNGQVAASAAAIASWTGNQSYRCNATFTNTSASLVETLLVTVLRAGGTARRIFRAVLAPNESVVAAGIILDSGDTLKASTTDATTVDYDVSVAPDSAPLSITCYDANGAVKQVNTGVSGNLTVSGLFFESFTPTITAHSGGTQAGAVALTAMINRVSTVAAQGDSVALPASAVGLEITVLNRGANPLQVFGAGTDTINGIATATGISQGVNTTVTYTCNVAGNWEAPLSDLWSQTPVALTTNGAIPPHVAHTYVITKAGVLADTLAAPTATTDDGIQITITSDTANAHTLTATGLLDTGTASVNVATFAAQKGAGLTLMAYNGRWKVLSSVGITFS